MKRLYPLLLLILVLALSITACGGKPKEQAQVKATTEAVEPTATSRPEREITPTETKQPTPTATPTPKEEKETPLPTATLAPTTPAEEEKPKTTEIPDWIKTYRTLLTMKWQSTQENKTTSGSAEVRGEYIVDPPREHIIITSTEEGKEPQTMEWIALEKTAWLNAGGDWMQVQMDEQQALASFGFGFWATPGLLSDIEGYKRIQPDEEINGILCEHYALDEDALAKMLAESMGGVTAASGEAWVSKKDHFTVKYIWHMEGKDVGLEGGEGTADWSWEIHDINVPLTIEPPAVEEIGGAARELPMMPDAQVTMAMGSMTMYTTASSVEDVVAFYEAQMPVAGWTQKGETTQMESATLMEFTKKDQSAHIMITPAEEGEGSQVMLTVE